MSKNRREALNKPAEGSMKEFPKKKVPMKKSQTSKEQNPNEKSCNKKVGIEKTNRQALAGAGSSRDSSGERSLHRIGWRL